mmetsp:Transcript_4163/g.11233  ORF Transcript_4163/g.11233 Transcript_4163/m.11233 type:complete len:218 (-) Transcript_4163:426-1079(-)
MAGVHGQAAFDHFHELIREVREALLQRGLLRLAWYLDAIVTGVLRHEVGQAWRQRSQRQHGQPQLVCTSFPREHGAPTGHLAHKAADGPHINFGTVVVIHQHLGWPVPARDHIGGVICCFLGVQGAGKSKITDFDSVVGADEDVGRLQVAVHHLSLVQEADCLEQLPADHLGQRWRETPAVLAQVLCQCSLHILHDHVDASAPATEGLHELDHVVVL